MPPETPPYALDNRALLRVRGEDAESFLQNVFTNDIGIVGGELQYNLLLTPQGQVLHDVFVFRTEEGFHIDVERARQEDLQKRLAIFRLRARVAIEAAPFRVYSCARKEGDLCFQDPRLSALGFRRYSTGKEAADGVSGYEDLCISFGIPNGGRAVRYGRDFAHDVNLDLLNAISWSKGCFIGQEVAARVHNRGLAKKRLMIVKGKNLEPDEDIREVNTVKNMGLGVFRIDNPPENAQMPAYFDSHNIKDRNI